jgi:putative endonuclease
MVYYVYIAACRSNTAIHIGVTYDLRAEMRLLRLGQGHPYCARYKICKLVWSEAHADLGTARLRADQLKRWRRAWKDALIVEHNQGWRDLVATLKQDRE